MNYQLINQETWHRKEHFAAFMAQGTRFSMTTKLDVTKFYQGIKERKIKFYPAFIHQVTQVINEFDCFKVAITEHGELILWDNLEPNYTISSKVSDNFISVWTKWDINFESFQKAYLKTAKEYETSNRLAPQLDFPENILPISMIPWTSFDGFDLSIKNKDNFLGPIITGGKMIEENDRRLLPIAVQVHHATCDGFHVSQFLARLQEVFDQF